MIINLTEIVYFLHLLCVNNLKTTIIMQLTYKAVSAAEAVKVIKSGDHVHLSSVASVPQVLVSCYVRPWSCRRIKDVHIHHLHTEGPAAYAEPDLRVFFNMMHSL